MGKSAGSVLDMSDLAVAKAEVVVSAEKLGWEVSSWLVSVVMCSAFQHHVGVSLCTWGTTAERHEKYP